MFPEGAGPATNRNLVAPRAFHAVTSVSTAVSKVFPTHSGPVVGVCRNALPVRNMDHQLGTSSIRIRMRVGCGVSNWIWRLTNKKPRPPRRADSARRGRFDGPSDGLRSGSG